MYTHMYEKMLITSLEMNKQNQNTEIFLTQSRKTLNDKFHYRQG